MTIPTTSRVMIALGCALMGLASTQLAGCIEEGARTVPTMTGKSPPSEPRIARLLLTLQYPRDTNDNGYPDSMTTMVRLFEEEPGWPLPMAVPGTFKIDMIDSQKVLITSWTFDEKAAEAAAWKDAAGVYYRFELSLLTGGRTDQMKTESVDVRATFTPTKGGISPTGTASRTFGRTR